MHSTLRTSDNDAVNVTEHSHSVGLVASRDANYWHHAYEDATKTTPRMQYRTLTDRYHLFQESGKQREMVAVMRAQPIDIASATWSLYHSVCAGTATMVRRPS